MFMREEFGSFGQGSPYRIRPVTPKVLSRAEELALLEKAHAADPDNRSVMERLAQACFAHDRFDEAIALLEVYCRTDEHAEALHTWGLCLLARENEADTQAAIEILQRAVAAAKDQRSVSFALSAIGKALLRQERMNEAREVLADAVSRYPNNKDAFKRLTMCDFLENRDEDALALSENLIASGTLHPRTFAVKTMALARLGRIEEARATFGLDTFLSLAQLRVPEGWSDIASFNRDLAEELINHPGYHYERYGAASAHSWRVDDPDLARCKAISALLRALQQAAEDYVANIAETSHPWPRGRQDGAEIHPWAVISYGSGFENWHVHQNGWLSGAYYIEVPEGIRSGEGNEGCIGFGLPETIVGDEAHEAFGLRMIRPEPGLLALFPSHSFHRTFPYSGEDRRICFAFDIATPPLRGETA